MNNSATNRFVVIITMAIILSIILIMYTKHTAYYSPPRRSMIYGFGKSIETGLSSYVHYYGEFPVSIQALTTPIAFIEPVQYDMYIHHIGYEPRVIYYEEYIIMHFPGSDMEYSEIPHTTATLTGDALEYIFGAEGKSDDLVFLYSINTNPPYHVEWVRLEFSEREYDLSD